VGCQFQVCWLPRNWGLSLTKLLLLLADFVASQVQLGKLTASDWPCTPTSQYRSLASEDIIFQTKISRLLLGIVYRGHLSWLYWLLLVLNCLSVLEEAVLYCQYILQDFSYIHF